jgi:hypothetical protein
MSNDDRREPKGGIQDDSEGGTTGSTSMTDGDWRDGTTGQPVGGGDERLGGRSGGPAEAELGGRDPGPTTTPPPSLQHESASGPGADGAYASGTYNERGDLTGPDSPAGQGGFMLRDGEGQGDDLADRLGGGEGRGTGMSGGGAATGSLDAERSRPDPESALGSAGAGAPSGGDPGGMGGVHAQGGTGTGRPPGGVSPVQADADRH